MHFRGWSAGCPGSAAKERKPLMRRLPVAAEAPGKGARGSEHAQQERRRAAASDAHQVLDDFLS